MLECDICVVGGGSGGIGAAIGAASSGASVIVVERNACLGGTAAMAWVHTWEPVCGSSPLCKRLWERMCALPLGARKDIDYETSSRRMGANGKRNPSLPFEPWAFQKAALDELEEAGVRLILNTSFVASERQGRKVRMIRAIGPGGALTIKAKAFIDSTADIHLAREAGCEHTIGCEAKSLYDEPHAPDEADPADINLMNWCYRVRTGVKACGDGVKELFPKEAIKPRPSRFEVSMPNGDILVNPCGMFKANPGDPEEFSRAAMHWWKITYALHRWTVQEGECPDRVLIGIAPQLGVRESYRLVGRHVLTENAVLAGATSASDATTCDHPLDLHGRLHLELERPYGIPLACLQAKEFDNLLVACRGASFSHVAASSARLSRTIMTLGEVAGRYAAMS